MRGFCLFAFPLIVFFILLSGCAATGYCLDIFSRVNGGYASCSPGTDSIKLGESVRFNIEVPFHLRTDDSTQANVSREKNFQAELMVRNIRKRNFTGTTAVLIGAIEGNSDSLGSPTWAYLAKADTSAVFSLRLTPGDTGIYEIRSRFAYAGNICNVPQATELAYPGGNHQYLVETQPVDISDSAYYSHSYYFKVVP